MASFTSDTLNWTLGNMSKSDLIKNIYFKIYSFFSSQIHVMSLVVDLHNFL